MKIIGKQIIWYDGAQISLIIQDDNQQLFAQEITIIQGEGNELEVKIGDYTKLERSLDNIIKSMQELDYTIEDESNVK